MASSSSSSKTLDTGDQHNVCGFLLKPQGSDDYHEIIDFLKCTSLRFALTVNPSIFISHINDFWTSAVVSEVDGVKNITATVNEKRIIITEASIRAHLLLDDADGMECYATSQIHDQLVLYGYEGERTEKLTYYKQLFSPQWKFLIHTLQHCISQKKTSWEQFSSNIASALICLANNEKFNFSKLIFNGMVNNLEKPKDKFLMYPRFLQHIFDQEIQDLPREGGRLILSNLSKKTFSNMRRKGMVKGKEFSGKVTNLTEHMLNMPSTVPQEVETPTTSQPSGTVSKTKRTRDPKPSKPKAKKAKKQTTEAPLPQLSQSKNTNEVVTEEQRDHMERATTTVATSLGEQDSGTGIRTQSMATQDIEMPLDSSIAEDLVDINISSGPRCQETTMGVSDAQTRSETLAKSSNDPLKEGNTSGNGEDSLTIKELTAICTKLSKEVEDQRVEIAQLKEKVDLLMKERDELKREAEKPTENEVNCNTP